MSIYLVRHGQSIGNLDLKNYQKIADHAFELTDLGKEQAAEAAEILLSNSYLKKASDAHGGWDKPKYVFWISPFRRARETAAEIISRFVEEECEDLIIDRIESPLIIEKQYGLYNQIAGGGEDAFKDNFPRYDEEYKKSHKYDGRFWARPPGGESDFDVFVRAEIFLEKLHRYDPQSKYNHVVVCHGTTMRILAMAAMNKEYEWFQRFKLPHNGEVIVPGVGHLGLGVKPFHE